MFALVALFLAGVIVLAATFGINAEAMGVQARQ